MNDVNNEIKPGTTLITAKPFVFSLSEKFRRKRCDYCFKKNPDIQRCSKCQFVYYCNRNCQKLAWNVHKFECPNIKKVYPKILPDAAKMMARIIIKLKNSGDDEKGFYTSTEYRTFKDLMSNVSSIKKDLQKMEHFVSLSMILHEFFPKSMIPSSAELLEIFGRLTTNSFQILDLYMNSLGVGLYLGPSIINHSCKPNACVIFEGTTIIIKSLCHLPVLDWSKIHISYIDTLRDTNHRQSELRKHYYFDCDCVRCGSPDIMEIAAACPNTSCTNPCLPNHTYCNKCGKKFSRNFSRRYETVKDCTNFNITKLGKTPCLNICESSLKEQKGVLHSYNLLTVQVLQSAFTAATADSNFKEIDYYVSQLIPRYIYYLGEIYPIVGHTYYTWGQVLLCLNKKRKALEITMKAFEIMKITFGENHSIMKEKVKPFLDQLIADHHTSMKNVS